MSYAVKVENLKKSYGDHTVLKGLSFHVKKGEVFALLGGNGAGKPPPWNVEGLRRYDSGAIAVNGRVGIQLQSSSLPAHIRPLEAVRLFAEWNRVKADTATLCRPLGSTALQKAVSGAVYRTKTPPPPCPWHFWRSGAPLSG